MVRFLAFLNLLGVISSFAGGLLLSYALTLKSSNYREWLVLGVRCLGSEFPGSGDT